MLPYVPPTHLAEAYNCPHCNAYAKQMWGMIDRNVGHMNLGAIPELRLSTCSRCERYAIWRDEELLYPPSTGTAPPNADLPPDVLADYEEAQRVVSASPRSAAALLRLGVQKLCKALGQKGQNINDDIAALVRAGLSPKLQQALDIVRVVGNSAVHPGKLDLRDDVGTAMRLFELVNLIADSMISQPKAIDSMYNDLIPSAQRQAIGRRDSV